MPAARGGSFFQQTAQDWREGFELKFFAHVRLPHVMAAVERNPGRGRVARAPCPSPDAPIVSYIRSTI
jgi:hypothetical protein